MTDVDQLGLSFRALDLKFCTGTGGVNPDDEVTDDNKVIVRHLPRSMVMCTEKRAFLDACRLLHGLQQIAGAYAPLM